MKTIGYIRVKWLLAVLAPVMVAGAVQSCADLIDYEKMAGGDAYFTIENNPTGINMGEAGNMSSPVSYVVRSNRSWTIVPRNESDLDWTSFFPMSGEGDGIVKIYVRQSNVFSARTATFDFMMEGQSRAAYTVSQDAATPIFTVVGASDGGTVDVSQLGEVRIISITTNLQWTAAITPVAAGESTDWATIDTEASSLSSLVINVEPIPDAMNERSVNVNITVSEFPEFNTSFVLLQENIAPLEGLPVTWSLNATGGWVTGNQTVAGTTEYRWVNEQTIYSNEGSAAYVQYIKGPAPADNSDLGSGYTATSYDVSGNNPRVNRGRAGDMWFFTVPIRNGRENQGIRMSGAIRSSEGGVAWYMLEFSTDNANWTAVDPTTYTYTSGTPADGIPIDYTSGIAAQDGSLNWPFEKTFTIPDKVADGFYYIRMRVTTEITQSGALNVTVGGSNRLVDIFTIERL